MDPRWHPLADRFMSELRGFDFLGRHLDVRENVKFRGGHLSGWIHETFPDSGCALAVEIKKFFMDEWTGDADEEQTETLEGGYVSPRLELHFRAEALDTQSQHERPEGRLRLMWSPADGKLIFEAEEVSKKGTFPTYGPTPFGVHELTADMV